MASGSNSARRMVSLFRPSSSILENSSVCRTCKESLSTRRSYATATESATATTTQSTSQQPQSSQPITATPITPIYNLNAGLVLSRPPQITRDLTAFEKSFYLYQKRLNERLVLPFTRYFYYQKGTVADLEWRAKYKLRGTTARDIGGYNAYSKEAWNDEVLVGAPESEQQHQIEQLITDAATNEKGDRVHEVPTVKSRVTEADQKGDLKSLDRLLQRTLYLLVQGKEGVWKFPQTRIAEGETVREAADRSLVAAAGVNMNTWTVGFHPIGHYAFTHRAPRPGPDASTQIVGEKTFYLKGRIMAGQADLEAGEKELGIKDFRWLAKEEVQKVVSPMYWKQVKNMLAEL